MNKRPGQPKVTIETGYCSFCDRTRNLRHEERLLGALVRTVVTCESCHRTLSSSMGVATAESLSEEPAVDAAGQPADDAAVAEVEPAATQSAAEPKAKRADVKPAASRAPKAAASKLAKPRGKSQRSR